jgi:aminoglycoside 2''-phosphotransferase
MRRKVDKITLYLQQIRHTYPELAIKSAILIGHGQFNDILQINDDLIFRFPRFIQAAEIMVYEVAALRALHKVLTTLPIPDPIYVNSNASVVSENFMGYRMLAGKPLSQEAIKSISDESILDCIASQLGKFLRELHSIPADTLPVRLHYADGRTEWQETYQAFREQLFPYMRPDAREEITLQFETFLNEPQHFTYAPTLRHGDFGGSNILYDAESQTISGIIDFSFIAIGDPAYDIASISTCGNAFLQRICKVYPEAQAMLERATFYRSTFALLQALYGLRDGDHASFEDGIAEYVPV